MRLGGRFIPRDAILDSVDTYKIIEEYSKDKYRSSYLILAKNNGIPLHILASPDTESNSVTIITAYRPEPLKWEKDFKTRRKT
jgi:hypothetical protein